VTTPTVPSELPTATGLYQTLYLVALALHGLAAGYVLSGTAYMLVHGIFGRRNPSPKPPGGLTVADVLWDWMPFAVGAAITAGVLPLILVQIFFNTNYYTANLLLFYRRLALVPVLLIGFYLVYLPKSGIWSRVPRSVRVIGAAAAFLCFAYTAHSWAENHMLSVTPSVWPQMYAESRTTFFHPSLIPRLAIVFFGSFSNMLLIVGWQIVSGGTVSRTEGVVSSAERAAGVESDVRRSATIALVTLALALIAVGSWYALADPVAQSAFISWRALPFLVAALGGLVMQSAAWLRLRSRLSWNKGLLLFGSGGAVITLLGTLAVRECIREASVDLAAEAGEHAAAARMGGWGVFLICLVVNAALITWCIRAVRRGLPAQPSKAPELS